MALLACKAYVIATPVLALLCLLLREDPGKLDSWTERIMAAENAGIFLLLQIGYIASIVTLVVGAVAVEEKRAARNAAAFAILAVASLVVFYWCTRIPPTRHL